MRTVIADVMDGVRIKIWREAALEVIDANKAGSSDSQDDARARCGGNIVIHKPD